MQNTKDTFYVALRERLAALNPGRTFVARGATRPAVLVEENELLQESGPPRDAFVLRWSVPSMDESEAMPLDRLTCEIAYATEGSALAAGMDRGRMLDAMDGELRSILVPPSAAKQAYAASPASVPATEVFWSDVAMAAAVVNGASVSRVATVTVFGFREPGEL